VKAVSIYRGRDPRQFALMAFGGNGPVVAAEIARALQMARVLVPPAPSAFSNSDLLIWPSPLVSILANSCEGDCAVTPLADSPCREINAAMVLDPKGEQLWPAAAVPEVEGSVAVLGPDKDCINSDKGSLVLVAMPAPDVACASSDCR